MNAGEQVKNELKKPIMASLMHKHAVEDFLPDKKKILHVVDHEIHKCKKDYVDWGLSLCLSIIATLLWIALPYFEEGKDILETFQQS